MGSSLSGLAFPCILGAIIGLVVLNFRHSLRCENAVEHDVTEEFIEALQRRLELAESESVENLRAMEYIKHVVSLRLASLDPSKLKEIYESAESVAVSDALRLQSVVGLPFPIVFSEESNSFGTSSGDVTGSPFDDVSLNAANGTDQDEEEDDDYYNVKASEQEGSMGLHADVPAGEETGQGGAGVDDINAILEDDASKLSDGEKTKTCSGWMTQYNVHIGQSWGELPDHMQHKWLSMHCDYFLQKERFEGHDATLNAGENVPTSSPTQLLKSVF